MLSQLIAQLYNSTTTNQLSGVTVLVMVIVSLLAAIFLGIVPLWKIYKKFGRAGWPAIVPIYGTWVLFEIVGFPGWWALLQLIPLINIFTIIVILVSYVKLAKLMGKSTLFGVLTIFFSFICLPILGYGKAQPVQANQTQPPAPPPSPSPPSDSPNLVS